MANNQHVEILKQGVEVWNRWRKDNPGVTPDLAGFNFREDEEGGGNFSFGPPMGPDNALISAELKGIDLSHANLTGAKLYNIDFSSANFQKANLSEADLVQSLFYKSDLSFTHLNDANLSEACFDEADLSWMICTHAEWIRARLISANFTRAMIVSSNLVDAKLSDSNLHLASFHACDLSEVDFRNAQFSKTKLTETNLTRARFTDTNATCVNFEGSILVETDFEGADLSGSRIYGISAWDLKLSDKTKMKDLVITKKDMPKVMVDNLEVAQFIYLLLNNDKIRDIIDTIGEKGVLILGRFTEERKTVLDAIRDRLRELGFVPMMFDFERPVQRDFTETIKTLAGLSRFIIADITNPKSSPLELQAIMPDYMIPFVPIIQEDEEPFAMFRDLNQKYGEWVLDVLEYDTIDNLLKVLENAVVKPALEKADRLMLKKAEAIRKRHVGDYQ
jgi:uncharacterized protein YjbI with pentapeptide repeats